MIWLPEALEDVERLVEFLYEKSLVAAARAAATILEGAQILEKASEAGRPLGDETGRRELIIRFGTGAYVLRYKLDAQGTVVVIRVWHARENRA